jgi:hypothetical protein
VTSGTTQPSFVTVVLSKATPRNATALQRQIIRYYAVVCTAAAAKYLTCVS